MSEDVLERAKIIAEKMGDRRIYYAGCWTLAEDLGYSKTGENTEFKEVAHPEDFIWCEVLPGINLLPELIAEVERLRSDQDAIMAAWDKDAVEHDARIKELEEANRNIDKRRDEMAAFIERLEADFLDHLAARLYYEHYPGVSDAYSWHDYPEDACQMRPKEMFRQKAREALEQLRAGGKDEA